jgi:hypothetical protein
MKCSDEKFIAIHPEDQMRYWNFKEFESIPTLTDYTLVSTASDLPKIFETYTNIVLFLWEEPNDFWVPSIEEIVKKNYFKIHKLISNCPYSTEYYNNLYGNDKRICGFNPFNINNIPTDFTKIYDVYFTGHYRFNPWLRNVIEIINKFNNAIVSFDGGNFSNVGFHKKIQINSNSKISVVWNCLYETSGIKMWEKHPGHKTIEHLKYSRFTPQIKTRTLEAAACKSIMLCHFEEFRIVETMFTPDKDFIYWYNTNDLEEKIHEILSNYDKYTHLAEHAHQTLINNWTTYHFFEKYLRNL